jgi:hypothetical protein
MGRPGGARAVVHVPPDRLPAACDTAAALLHGGTPVELVVADAAGSEVATVATLARLVLVSRRCGTELVVRAPDAALAHVAELLGLCDVLGLPRVGRQVERQAEPAEDLPAEVLEEVVDVPDPAV